MRSAHFATHVAMALGTALIFASAASAQPDDPKPGRPSSEGGTISATFENDIFGGTDRNYTNGVRLDYVTPRNDLPGWARFARDILNIVW